MSLSLSPQGRLHIDETTAAGSSPLIADGLRAAVTTSSAQALRWLATRGLDAHLTPGDAFWRDFARRYFTRLCHTPELDVIETLPPPPPVELESLVLAAPPLPGAEYLKVETLLRFWRELDTLAFAEIADTDGGAQEWLREQNPVWSLVGRVTFHLAENKRDPDRPFAFLATYIHKISEQAKPQYLPLGHALQEHASARNRDALLTLLAPVQRAAAKSSLVRELVESKRVYQPQAWTPKEAHRFLRDIPLFEDAGLLVRLPDWWRPGRPTRPSVSVIVGDGKPAGLGLGALLDFKVELSLDGEKLTTDEWKHLASSDGLVLLRGKWVEVDRAKLDTVLAHWKSLERARAQGGLSFAEGLRLLSGAQPGEGAPEIETEDVRAWSHVRAGGWLEETLASLRQPGGRTADASAGDGDDDMPGLRATLRPYQRDGVRWLAFLARLRLGACLADDMGLGKTLQVLAALLQLRAAHPGSAPALLVLPASLLGNWRDEAERFAPSLRLWVAHPSENSTDALNAHALAGVDIVLTTYSMIGRLDWLRRFDWSVVILDEAQAIKNPGARQSRAVKELKAPVRFALTGTPVENNLGDLWSLFDFLNPGLLGGAADFKRYAKNLTESEEPGAFASLRQLVRPYILRRLKSDRSVISDLPDKTEVRAFCPLTKRQAVLYADAVKELTARLNEVQNLQRRGVVLAFLMRLKQLCNHPAQFLGSADYAPEDSGKFQRLAELAGEIASRQEKVLVFTQFREMTEPLHQFLTGIFNRPGLILHGGTSVKDRRGLVDQFQREDGPPFFILSLKAGGTGLTLTEAGHVIHFDRWWNPAVENQATDRAYRIGQKKNVLVHKFVCRGTLEEKIDRLIAEKQSLADEVLAEGGEVPLTEMGNDELLRFVSLDLRAAMQEE